MRDASAKASFVIGVEQKEGLCLFNIFLNQSLT